jgi:hypothetical protein
LWRRSGGDGHVNEEEGGKEKRVFFVIFFGVCKK